MIPRAAGPPGDILRAWRRRRHLSQLALALEAEISQRHLSCLESGRARPSRAMLLHLAARLGIPLRERNALLLAAETTTGWIGGPHTAPVAKAPVVTASAS